MVIYARNKKGSVARLSVSIPSILLSLLPQLYLWFCVSYLRMRTLSEDESYLKVQVIQGLRGIRMYRITEGLLSSICTFKKGCLLFIKSASYWCIFCLIAKVVGRLYLAR